MRDVICKGLGVEIGCADNITVLGCEMIYRSVVGFHLCLHITRVLCYLWNYHGDSLYHYTARRCCLYRVMVQVVYLYVVYPTHCHARLGVQYQCESLQVTINGAISRCQGACHQCLPNTLASHMFWSPPIVVHH